MEGHRRGGGATATALSRCHPGRQAAPAIATVLTAGLIVVAARVLVVTVLSNILAVNVTIHNEGCGDITVRAALEVGVGVLADSRRPDLLGIQLPEVIREGTAELLSIPPVDLEVVNVSEASQWKLRVLGEELPVPVSGAVDIRFDDESILGTQGVLRLGPREAHDLIIRCEG